MTQSPSKCAREMCDHEETRLNGYCSVYCEDIDESERETAELQSRVAELEAAIQAWNDTIGFDEHIDAVRVLQGLAKAKEK